MLFYQVRGRLTNLIFNSPSISTRGFTGTSFITMPAMTKPALTVNVFDNITKSSLDKRIYRGLILPNGLKALVISDPTTDKSAASLDVHVGSMSDPKNIAGLAHFCEHMLFLGTDKYPKEDEYQKFISQHAGSCNAFTSSEHTNYYFDIGHPHLEGALDRFSQFFLCPRFDQSCTDREINAVNSEHLKNVMQDSRRLHHIDQVTSDPDHPYCQFSTGNLETLSVVPQKQGINIRDELMKFHEKYYSANIMGLAVIGRESVDTLTEWVQKMFGEVVNKDAEVKSFDNSPYRDVDLMKKCYVAPVKDLRNLLLTFPMPDVTELYESSPVSYVAHLIGHEGPGSLLSLLKAKGWVNSLIAGQKGGATGFDFFIIQVDLTELGQNYTDEIMKCMFQYMELLRQEKPQEWIHNELRTVLGINFMFKDKEQPSSYATKLSSYLHKYPIVDILSANSILTEYNPDKINDIIECLKPEKMKVTLINKINDNKETCEEQWYGAKYYVEEINEDFISELSSVKLNPDLKLPLVNEFIAKDLEVKPPLVPTKIPKLLQNSEFSTVWFKQDYTFKLPKQIISFEFYSPRAYVDPHHANMAHFFTQLLSDNLNEYSYDAELAGLNYNLRSTTYGLVLKISGYNDKQKVLLEKILDKLTHFDIDVSRFDIMKDLYTRGLENFQMEQPYQHASYFGQITKSEKVFTKMDLLKEIDSLTVDEMKSFLPKFLQNIHIESFFHGNLVEQEALEITQTVEDILKKNADTKPLPSSQLRRYRDVILPCKSSHLFQYQNTIQNTNAVQMFFQIGAQNVEENVSLELLQQIISEPFFNSLRTKEQLGYITFTTPLRSNGTQGLRFLLQSEKSPSYLEMRVEAFVSRIERMLCDMDEEEFERHKSALAAKRLEKPKRLSIENTNHWNEINCKQYMFERDVIEVEHLKNVTKIRLLEFYRNYIHVNAEKRAKLSVHVYSKDMEMPEECNFNVAEHNKELDEDFAKCPKVQDHVVIKSMKEFKSSLALFERVKPFIEF